MNEMNINKLKELITKEKNIDVDSSDHFFPIIFAEKLAILNENLEETMAFLDTCTEEEFYWISNAFEDISEKYKSHEFIECIKRNMLRFPRIKDDIQTELKYALMHMGEIND